MQYRKLVSTSAFMLAIGLSLAMCFSTPRLVQAGGGPASTTGAANLKGIVKYEGTVPKPKPINMSADPSCAKQHPSPVFAQEVSTDGKGDLQDVIVFVADGSGDRTFDTPTQTVVGEQ